ncbi:MAG: YbjN domain-containing protein [Propionibacteriaceae bacterium]|nr:YbjN domain-containing protein [Propionibacteriaceae bacterium]
MALWFKKAQQGPAEVTIDRIADHFDEVEYNYDRQESGALSAIFDDVLLFVGIEDNWFRVTGVRWDIPLPVERGEEMIGWLNSYMAETRFGTGTIELDENNGRYDLSFAVVFTVAEGLYDDQLRDFLAAGMGCVIDGVKQFCERFEIPTMED